MTLVVGASVAVEFVLVRVALPTGSRPDGAADAVGEDLRGPRMGAGRARISTTCSSRSSGRVKYVVDAGRPDLRTHLIEHEPVRAHHLIVPWTDRHAAQSGRSGADLRARATIIARPSDAKKADARAVDGTVTSASGSAQPPVSMAKQIVAVERRRLG